MEEFFNSLESVSDQETLGMAEGGLVVPKSGPWVSNWQMPRPPQPALYPLLAAKMLAARLEAGESFLGKLPACQNCPTEAGMERPPSETTSQWLQNYPSKPKESPGQFGLDGSSGIP